MCKWLINPGKGRKISLLQYLHSKSHIISSNTCPCVKKKHSRKKKTKKNNRRNDQRNCPKKNSIARGGRGELQVTHTLHHPYTAHTPLLSPLMASLSPLMYTSHLTTVKLPLSRIKDYTVYFHSSYSQAMGTGGWWAFLRNFLMKVNESAFVAGK